MPNINKEREKVGLPPKPFLYTLEQIAEFIAVSPATLRARYVYFDRRSPGAPPRDELLARDISGPDDDPEWRVAEGELIRWLRIKGFRVTQRGWVSQ
jgi:hypothetical protein